MSDEEDMEIDVVDAGDEPAGPLEAPADSAEPEGASSPNALQDSQADAAEPVKRGRGRPKKANGTPTLLPPGKLLPQARFNEQRMPALFV